MEHLLQGFLLGNGAILTNVCLLPLYPGLIAYLAGNAGSDKKQSASSWLGLMVLAGVLSMMILVGFLLYFLQKSFAGLLPWLLPLIYLVVIVLGVLMLLGKNPFNRLTTIQAPILKNPILTSYLYGLLLGPMTLPCTGPIILTAFLVGSGNASALATELSYFLAFGLGFGWPLVLLPFLAMPLQRRATGWLGRNYKLLTRISGILLLGIGLFGFWTEVIPNLT
ncbi:MAG: hypothetical protein KC422_00070 [Trueperaceae bacterium]|nr:hypothetical protein [Trueperaceae bacterium]